MADFRKTIKQIELLVAIAHEDSGASPAERELASGRASKLMLGLGLEWSDFAHVTEPASSASGMAPARERKSKRQPAQQAKPQPRKASPRKASNPASPPAAQAAPAAQGKAQPGSKKRRNWTATELKLARQSVWDNLTKEEVQAHNERMKLDGGSRAAAQRAWTQTIRDGQQSGSLDYVEAECETVMRWALFDFAA